MHKVRLRAVNSYGYTYIRILSVHPAHLAFVLINEGGGDDAPGGIQAKGGAPLFASVIQRAGGDPVSLSPNCDNLVLTYSAGCSEAWNSETYRAATDPKPTTRRDDS